MIEVMQGTPGSGKSAAAVARALAHIRKGGVVASNFSLVDGWADAVAGRDLLSLFSLDHRYDLASSYYQRFYHVNTVDAVRAINPREISCGVYKNKGGYSEGDGLLILDECQLVFNSRKWQGNFSWIEFFTQHRKLGWNVLLIAHTIEMIDSQIRPLAEYESRFRNLQKCKFPFTPFPISPFPLFLVITRYAGLGAGANTVYSRDVYPLPLWAARLYDTLQVFTQEVESSSLPHLCGEPPTPPPCVGGGRVSLPRGKKSQISPACYNTLWDEMNGTDYGKVTV